jgi:hypothetical protein
MHCGCCDDDDDDYDNNEIKFRVPSELTDLSNICWLVR